jgi:hypothetical protein
MDQDNHAEVQIFTTDPMLQVFYRQHLGYWVYLETLR